MGKSHYITSYRFTPNERAKAMRIITAGVKRKADSADIIRNLKGAGVSYRKQNMQNDIRQKEAVIRARSPEARERARAFYKKVVEPQRIERKTTSRDITKIIRAARDRAKRIEYLASGEVTKDDIADYWEKYKGLA